MAALKSLNDLLIEELKDLYSAEKQLTKALPKMIKGANDSELADSLESHLRETEEQINRLESAGEMLGVKLNGKKCKGMEGLVEEGSEVMSQKGSPELMDLALIGAACRVEHYEMAGYQTAIGLAEQLGHSDLVELLQATLDEESGAEETLREYSERIASSAGETDSGETEAEVEDEEEPAANKTKMKMGAVATGRK